MGEKTKILCVDDEKSVLKSLKRLFMDDDYDILTASSGEEGLHTLEKASPISVVISDYRMPGMNGVDFLQKVHNRWPDTIRIVLSGYADTASVVAAINEGQIYRFIPKPWDDLELKNNITKAIEVYFLHKKNRELTEELTKKNNELRLLNENLEKTVAERTKELLFQNKVLTRSQNMLDALPIAVIGLDMGNMIVQCNMQGMAFFAPQGMVLGSAGKDVLPPELYEFINNLTEGELKSSSITSGKQKFRTKASLIKTGNQEGKILLVDTADI
jgi:two-component system NtrC family sensor kinase